jgi:hypothetical protein
MSQGSATTSAYLALDELKSLTFVIITVPLRKLIQQVYSQYIFPAILYWASVRICRVLRMRRESDGTDGTAADLPES